MSKAIYLLLASFLATTTLFATAGLNSIAEPWKAEKVVPLSNASFYLTVGNGLEQLNQSMQATLRLSTEQFKAINKTNRAFWKERQAILGQPEKVARHTALLAAWDRWARQLESILDKYQYKAFLKWQYAVSPLSEQPF